MKVKNSILVLFLSLVLLGFTGCQMFKTNRKPQSAGSNALCSDCLIDDIDKGIARLQDALRKSNQKQVKYPTVKTPVFVRSAVVVNKEGKPVCRVDLLKHPALMPSFAEPTSNNMVYQTSKSKRKLASAKSEESDLPPCPDKYLGLLKKTAKNNFVVNSNKSHIHKSSVKNITTGAVCLLGASANFVDSILSKDNDFAVAFMGLMAVGAEAESNRLSQELVKTETRLQKKWITGSANEILDLSEKMKMERIKKFLTRAAAVMGACYLGTEAVTVVYKKATTED